jgi:hypothetical protein
MKAIMSRYFQVLETGYYGGEIMTVVRIVYQYYHTALNC